jgi:uncharacterized protein (TIGR02391 family)
MMDRYISIIRLLRALRSRADDGADAESFGADGYAQAVIGEYICRDVRDLRRMWPTDLDSGLLDRAVECGEARDRDAFHHLRSNILPQLEDSVDEYFGRLPIADIGVAVLPLLHPVVVQSSYALFRSGHYRDAVLNGVVAVFDLLRERTKCDADGAQLVASALSLESPKLILSTLTTESGRNDQKGFLQILQGAYLGIRNPKAHSLASDVDQVGAAQYLIFASLLARRIEQAYLPSAS